MADNSREHLANERTFLAWTRTGIAIMAFGFVVVKFNLFVKQAAYLLQRAAPGPNKGYASVLGITLVIAGILITILAFVNYRRVSRQLERGEFRSSPALPIALTIFILLAGILLTLYLFSSI